jgi:hypothetical protein
MDISMARQPYRDLKNATVNSLRRRNAMQMPMMVSIMSEIYSRGSHPVGTKSMMSPLLFVT